MSLPENKVKTNVHNVHDVHQTETYELRQLGAWYFSDGPSGFDPHGDYSEYDTGAPTSRL